jgi:hypothetical protein
MKDENQRLSEIIVDYLRKNPEAGDTLAGITRWWLEMEWIDQAVDKVEAALDKLRREGVVRKYKRRGGTTFYKINKNI